MRTEAPDIPGPHSSIHFPLPPFLSFLPPKTQKNQVDEVLSAYAHASRPPAHQAKGKASAGGGGGDGANGVLRKLEDVRRRGRKRDMFG